MMRKTIGITGANGFIGKNAMVRLGEMEGMVPVALPRAITQADVGNVDAVIHLAGVNRPSDPKDFLTGNYDSTIALIDALERSGRRPLVLYASSTKASERGPYGESKRAAEAALRQFGERCNVPIHIFRLPNVFGKWCKPNYNSAVATFCHNIARDLPIVVNDPAAPLSLVYIDDVIDCFLGVISDEYRGSDPLGHIPIYNTTVGGVVEILRTFRADRDENLIEAVGSDFLRALYATYVSGLPVEQFAYEVVAHTDPRGSFSEVLKTRTSGQFSYFTAHPGVTRGGHYHHTKTEKFLIVQGDALFRFRNIITGETREIRTSSKVPVVVETIPGWAHDVTNVGANTMISLLWANEIFDRSKPDTIAAKV